MSSDNIKQRLADVEALNVGVVTTWAQVPAQVLTPAQFPAFINKMGPAQVIKLSDFLWYENRDYLCHLLVINVQAGISGEAERKVEPFIIPCRDTFLKHPGLGINTSDLPIGVQRSVYIGDTGIAVITFSGTQYLGVEYRIRVAEMLSPTIAPHE
jgi:hypothetical protein